MAYAQTRNAQVNQFTEQLLQYLMNKNLINQRQRGEMEYLGEQNKNWMGLEAYRQKGGLAELEQKYINEISQLEPVVNLRSQLQRAEQMGDEAKAAILRPQLRAEIAKPVDMMYKLITGRTDYTKEEILRGRESLTDAVWSAMGLSAATTARQKMAEPLEKEGQAIRRAELEVAKGKLGFDWAKLAQDDQVLQDKDRQGWIDLVKDVRTFLDSQGVKPEGAVDNTIRYLFSSGKVTDPLSREYAGQARQWLDEIRVKLLAKRPVSQADIFFLERVGNSYAIMGKEGGTPQGLPSRETGLFKSEENAVLKQQWQEAYNQALAILMNPEGGYGLSQGNADAHARAIADEYIARKKGQPSLPQ